MLKYTLVIITMFISSYVHADDYNALCSSIGKLAASIMSYRQDGGSYADMRRSLNESDSDNESVKKLNLSILSEAYREPRYMTDIMKERAVSDFSNMYELACYSALDKK